MAIGYERRASLGSEMEGSKGGGFFDGIGGR